MKENLDLFIGGFVLLIIGGGIWAVRDKDAGGLVNGYLTVAESISPFVTVLGALGILLGLLDAAFHILPF